MTRPRRPRKTLALHVYMEPMKENLYFFRKLFGSRLEVTKITFKEFLKLYPNNLVSTGKWAQERADAFLDTIYQKGHSFLAQKDESPEAYKAFLKMWNTYADFTSWGYDESEALKRLIVTSITDKQHSPIWYIPKDERFRTGAIT